MKTQGWIPSTNVNSREIAVYTCSPSAGEEEWDVEIQDRQIPWDIAEINMVESNQGVQLKLASVFSL